MSELDELNFEISKNQKVMIQVSLFGELNTYINILVLIYYNILKNWRNSMKRKILSAALVLVTISALVPIPTYASVGRRVVIDRKNYNTQMERVNGCWLAVARNFIVAQQPDRSAQSDSTVRSQYDNVCKTVKKTTDDVGASSVQEKIGALEEFDKLLGKGAHVGDYDCENGSKSFKFVFNEITEDGDPIAVTLGRSATSSSAHDVLINGADDGTNIQEVVRVLNNDKVIWAQYEDLKNGSVTDLGNRSWSATAWCD